MKLTDELKKKIDNATSTEEVKDILNKTKKGVEDAGIILDDAELDNVAGGRLPQDTPATTQILV